MTRKAVFFATTALCGAWLVGDAGQALAQDRGFVMEEMVVTARKRAENLQQVPVAVSAFNEAALQKSFAQDFRDLAGVAPNVVLDSGGVFTNATFFSIRGISFQDVESSFDPAVGVIVDGVFIGRNIGSLIDFFDLESIEILRGPQGTLFGKNTIGGSLNVRTKRPTGEFGITGQGTFGNKGRIDGRASIEGPIVKDVLAAKVSVLSQNFDNFYVNLVDGSDAREEDVLSVRTSLRLTPNDALTVDLIGDYTRDRSGSFGLVPVHEPVSGIGAAILGAGGSLADIDRFDPAIGFENFYNSENINDVDSYGVVADINWDVGQWTLTSVTGWRRIEEDVVQDFDATAFTAFETRRIQDQEQFSQELRITSNFDDKRWDLVAGLYYFRQEYDLTQLFLAVPFITDPGTGAIIGFAPVDLRFLPGGGVVNNVTSQDSDSIAVFAQGNYRITDKLRATLGIRYSYEEKDFTTDLQALGAASDTEDFDEITPRVGLDYQLNDDVFLFASWARGFKSGGFNGRAATTTSIGPFGEETVDAIEIGVKSDWFANRLRVNVTAFWNFYDDLQIELVRPAVTGSGQETVVENAASVETRGIELEAQAIPYDGVTLDLSVGYLDAEYEDFTIDAIDIAGNVLGQADLTGLDLRRAPEWTFRIGGEYRYPAFEGWNAAVRASWRYTSEIFTTVFNEDFGRRRGVGDLSASFDLTDEAGRYRISFFGKNLTDEIVVNSALSIAPQVLPAPVPPQDFIGTVGAFTSFQRGREFGGEIAFTF